MAQKWDLGRFIQTLDYFEAIPVVSWIQHMIQPRPNPQADLRQGQGSDRILFDFSNPSHDISTTWGALDDVVMGGVSTSSFQLSDGKAVFSGNVSTDNSGGFASVRTRNFDPAIALSEYTGIELRVKGDGNRYKFLVRDDDGWDSIGYSHSFDTVAHEWIALRIPFSSLIPVFRAKTMANAMPLNAGTVRSLQLMLSKFEYDGALNPKFHPGEFRLEVSSISAVRDA
ncbi:CIA30 family protein [Myxacorys almedinensis]|uniref:CIA30 family protein n=1 Tax=Myxacorys almedinensis A TaxID=2690445 RepID=A0A8J8CND2_9CYAN|nr:CIA30 family protein [Myxacorys almedinensis]NDJ18302.1 CIA30 family protein [Myxacorys almedinensis A]